MFKWFKKIFTKKKVLDKSLKLAELIQDKKSYLRLERYIDDGTRTIGRLFLNDVFVCYTLEDTYRDLKIKHKTRIPAGEYELALRYSPKFSPRYKHDLIWLKDVPNFDWILIHVGNTEKDTSGCILVGMEVVKNKMITKSLVAYHKIYAQIASKIKSGFTTIQIIDLCR